MKHNHVRLAVCTAAAIIFLMCVLPSSAEFSIPQNISELPGINALFPSDIPEMKTKTINGITYVTLSTDKAVEYLQVWFNWVPSKIKLTGAVGSFSNEGKTSQAGTATFGSYGSGGSSSGSKSGQVIVETGSNRKKTSAENNTGNDIGNRFRAEATGTVYTNSKTSIYRQADYNSQRIATVRQGEEFEVSAIIVIIGSAGGRWYEIWYNNMPAYIPCDAVTAK